MIAALETLKYDVAKGPEYYRACDHQAVQSVLVPKSKKKSEMNNEADLFKILEIEPGLGGPAAQLRRARARPDGERGRPWMGLID